jgi:Sec-independent protein translocase protein TatA
VGTELLLGVALGFMILGPQRMHAMLAHLGRAKAEFDKASRSLRSQLSADLDRVSARDGSSLGELASRKIAAEGEEHAHAEAG